VLLPVLGCASGAEGLTACHWQQVAPGGAWAMPVPLMGSEEVLQEQAPIAYFTHYLKVDFVITFIRLSCHSCLPGHGHVRRPRACRTSCSARRTAIVCTKHTRHSWNAMLTPTVRTSCSCQAVNMETGIVTLLTSVLFPTSTAVHSRTRTVAWQAPAKAALVSTRSTSSMHL
jgi:hypothetical protein